MTICRGGQDFDGAICTAGAPINSVCRGGVEACAPSASGGGGTSPIAPAMSIFECFQGDPITENIGIWRGDTPISLSAFGLPDGVVLIDQGNGTYNLVGNCPSAGVYNYTVTASNAFGTQQSNDQIISTVRDCPDVIGDPITRIEDSFRDVAGNDSEAQIMIGDLAAAWPNNVAVASINSGVTSGDKITSFIGGTSVAPDTIAIAQGNLPRYTNLPISEISSPENWQDMRVIFVSGRRYNAFDGIPPAFDSSAATQALLIQEAAYGGPSGSDSILGQANNYTLGDWVPYGPNLAISVATRVLANSDLTVAVTPDATFHEVNLRVEMRCIDGSVTSFDVQLLADAARTQPIPIGGGGGGLPDPNIMIN